MALFVRLVVVFIFHIALFPLQPVNSICSQAHILTSWEFLWYPVTENNLEGPPGYVRLFLKKEAQSNSETLCFKKI